MVATAKTLRAFVEGTPDGKLVYLPPSGTIHITEDFRLHVLGVTSEQPPRCMLYIQVNKGTRIATMKKMEGKNIVGPLFVPADTTTDPIQIKRGFLEKIG
ncbi:hypothetical protein F4802DRAFT_613781 [Xylaria palmicola]|nr:hypothetical protein F4802DRAFT_613781 [Xylaria palmicola]